MTRHIKLRFYLKKINSGDYGIQVSILVGLVLLQVNSVLPGNNHMNLLHIFIIPI